MKRKYTLNESYFENIDSHEKAYFLGILMADGYNHETKGEVILGQADNSIDILEKLQKEVGYIKILPYS